MKKYRNIEKISLVVSIVGILFLVIGASYAIFSDTFKSDKKQVVEVGSTKIELIEPSTGLSLGSVEEMSDSNGLLQENYYSFSVKNTGDSDTKYNLYLLDDADTISTYEGTLLADKYVRVGLDKNGTELGPLNLDIQKRLIDTGIINAGATNNYKLRLWFNFGGLTDSEKDALDGQSKFLKLKLTGEQNFSNTLADTIIKRDLKTNKNEANGLFSSNDTNSGKSTYYYKGEVDNNYVMFANMMWRIVRVNEDGTVRLIMQEGIDNKATYCFNPNRNDYNDMYYSNSNVEGGIMKRVNDWYNTNLKDYDDVIITGDFCEEARVTYNENETVISGSASLKKFSDYNANFKCMEDANGKGILYLKVGLITMDEALFAINTEKNSYLIKESMFLTMSPAGIDGSNITREWYVTSSGNVSYTNTKNNVHIIRPVINLRSNVMINEGNGSVNTPFVIK